MSPAFLQQGIHNTKLHQVTQFNETEKTKNKKSKKLKKKGIKKMKLTKLVAAVLTLVLFAANVYSQSTGMGIEGGINLANISTTPVFNTSNKTGFMIGGFADIGVSNIVSIKPGARFIMKGYTIQNQFGNTTGSYSYIDIPLMIKARVPLNKVKPYFEAGPFVSVQLAATAETSINGQVQNSEDISANYNAIDFGLYFGSGVEFTVAPGMDLFTGFGYSLGLTNIHKSGTQVKTNGFQMNTGIKFGL